MAFIIREFTMEDYDAAYELWDTTPGMGLSEADTSENIGRFLERNPGISQSAVNQDGALIGTILGGHDGRRGFLYHLAVRTAYRGQGIGEALVSAALQGLSNQSIDKCHIMVLADNYVGQGFWSKVGWQKRDNLFIYSANVKPTCQESSDCPC